MYNCAEARLDWNIGRGVDGAFGLNMDLGRLTVREDANRPNPLGLLAQHRQLLMHGL
jgi:hypothetical protein